jgi:hypothetical protein
MTKAICINADAHEGRRSKLTVGRSYIVYRLGKSISHPGKYYAVVCDDGVERSRLQSYFRSTG